MEYQLIFCDQLGRRSSSRLASEIAALAALQEMMARGGRVVGLYDTEGREVTFETLQRRYVDQLGTPRPFAPLDGHGLHPEDDTEGPADPA